MSMLAIKVMRVTDVRLRYTGAWFLLAIGMSFSMVAYAGPGVWTSGGPYGSGGDVRALAIDPTTPATVYAGTSDVGVFRSTDSGGTWAAANTGLTNLDVDALAINPTTPATLYAGTSGSGVFKSTDSGGTWAAASTGLTNLDVQALAINPTTPATLYAGTIDGGVFKSNDSGGTWAAANTGLTSAYVSALAINPLTPATLYAGTSGGGVFKSTDSGGTWAATNTGLRERWVKALAINPTTPTTLYAGGSGVFKSTDSGGTWAAASTGLNPSVQALAINPTTPATLYAGTSFGGVFRSTDSGGTWAAVNTGLPSLTIAITGVTNLIVWALAINPTTPATLYAGTWNGGVFKSTDSGGTWAAANTGLPTTYIYIQALAINPTTPATLYAGTSDGVFKSTDSGGTWAAANTGLTYLDVTALAINPTTPATLYAGTYVGGVFKSTDSGGTWAAASTGLTNLDVTALAINPTAPATLYAGTRPYGFFKSTDSGGTWADASTGLTNPSMVSALAINPMTPATLYAGTYPAALYGDGGGVFKSTDSGGTWAAASTGLTYPWMVENLFVRALAINPTTPATLYAGTSDGVFKSTDSGGTWAGTGPNQYVDALAINPTTPATLYAGGVGVFKSTDSGRTWAAVATGLPSLTVQALALDPTGATTLYAGLSYGSVWQSTPPTGGTTTALLPTSAHSWGVNGAFYTTNVSIAETGVMATSFTLKFLGNNQDGSTGPEQTFILDPGKSSTYFDVLGSVFNETNNFGAVRITSSSSTLNIVSVTSTPGFGGTFGQTLPAVSSSDLIPAGSARSILYIREGDGFRSNLILASNASAVTNVDAMLVSPAGAALATKTYPVPPNGMTQINRVVRDMGVSGPITGARLVLSSSTSGAAFTGFASVIDETTNDPTAILVQPASVSGSAPYIWLLPTSAHSSGANGAFYTTALAIANVGAAFASFTMTFLGNNQDGSGGPEQTFDLDAGKSVTYFDVLGSVFHQTSNFGAIRITSSTSFLNIVSVTSTPGFGGTFGLTLPAVSSSDLIHAGSPRSILYIREGDGFRSNLILASNANVSTAVLAALISPAGTILAEKSYSIPPNGMTQINRIVRDMGVSGPITGARLVLTAYTLNAAFTAFASVIDEITNNPTAVEAR
jgi:photosystem II stability/assembly factor-like uncharacterized protein